MKVSHLPYLLLTCIFIAGNSSVALGNPQAPNPLYDRHISDKPIPHQLAGQDSVYSTLRNDRLFDSIESRYTRSAFSRMLYNSVFIKKREQATVQGNVIDESKLFTAYAGREISKIEIFPSGLIGSDSTRLERAASSLHTTTRRWILRRDLLFHPGEPFDPEILIKSLQTLRSRNYLSDVAAAVRDDPDAPEKIIVSVYTQDKWSIGGNARINSDGRTNLRLYDANILGYGGRLSLGTNFNWRGMNYGGTEVQFDMPNALGTFFDTHLEAIEKFEDHSVGFKTDKEFRLPTDYAGGVSWYDQSRRTYLLYADSSFQIASRTLDVWAGYSFRLPRLKSSLYVTGRYTDSYFKSHPPVERNLNPAFHDQRLSMVAFGSYCESFYTSNLIYGYGNREYLAAGHRIESLFGYSDGEFEDQWYAGMSYRLGGFNRLGYLMGAISVGSYFARDNFEVGRGAFKLDYLYFTNLMRLGGGRTRVRQFATLSWLQGWNRYRGEAEVVGFRHEHGIRALDLYTVGVNRLDTSLETVFFTPYQPLGFRLAAFVYTDLGLLGTHANPLNNPFYGSTGLGIRIKNERLVFNTLEIRLGFAYGSRGLLRSQYFYISNQDRIEPIRFRPEAPQPIPFR